MKNKEVKEIKEIKKDEGLNYSGVGFGYFTDPNSITAKLIRVLLGRQK